jgi:hypothetical protein
VAYSTLKMPESIAVPRFRGLSQALACTHRENSIAPSRRHLTLIQRTTIFKTETQER